MMMGLKEYIKLRPQDVIKVTDFIQVTQFTFNESEMDNLTQKQKMDLARLEISRGAGDIVKQPVPIIYIGKKAGGIVEGLFNIPTIFRKNPRKQLTQ